VIVAFAAAGFVLREHDEKRMRVMFHGLTLLVMLDPTAGIASQMLLSARNHSHFDNYTLAYREAQRTQRPLLVVLNPGAESDVRPVQITDVLKTAQRRQLLERYVVVVIDTTTPHGRAVHHLFENPPLPHVAVIDRDQKWQVLRTSRRLQGDDWTRILETFQNGESTARLNLDLPLQCPT
jgi:hypothetical protein